MGYMDRGRPTHAAGHRAMKAELVLLLTLCAIFSILAAGQTIDSPPFASPEKGRQATRHVSEKDDISRIGQRNVGHTGFGNWYSFESEIALGKEYSGIVEANLKLLDDPLVTEYVNRIGEMLVKHSDAKVPFTIKVVDCDELNAFTLPGGFLYVNYGVILFAEDEAELAGVMAHEIAHVAARHATRQMTRTKMFSLMSLPVELAGGGILGQAIQLAAGFAKPMEMLKFSRGFESEADYFGLEYLYAAGYDPQAFISFLERAGAEEKNLGKWGGLFSTHPLMTSRIKKSQIEIARIFPQRDSYIVNTSHFDDVKAHLLALVGSNKAEAQQKAHEPLLKRRLPGSGPTRD
jgi:beta-barrel assembly-enhancing protease